MIVEKEQLSINDLYICIERSLWISTTGELFEFCDIRLCNAIIYGTFHAGEEMKKFNVSIDEYNARNFNEFSIYKYRFQIINIDTLKIFYNDIDSTYTIVKRM